MSSGSPQQIAIAELERKHEEVSARLEELNINVSAGMEEIRSILRAQSQQFNDSSSPHPSPRNNPNTYGTRISKVDFPKVDGKKLRELLYKCNQLFTLDDTAEDAKVRLASIHLEGVALQWHVNFMLSKFDIYPTWSEYVMEVTQCFGEVFEDPLAALIQVKQTGGVQEYIDAFELALTQMILSKLVNKFNIQNHNHVYLHEKNEKTYKCTLMGGVRRPTEVYIAAGGTNL